MFSLLGCQSTESYSNSKNDQYSPEPYVKVKHPEWSKNAILYQLNTRQFTEEGTFVAAAAQLPRLKELGIDIIWLMPVNPIGELNRKGTLGSPYSVKDYYGVNPEFGSLDDLKFFVNQAHELGMKVILDWVANHTSWDNELRTTNPEWYQRDYKGDFRPTPWWDWSDIINLDYSQPGIREYMTAAMKYWVQEVGMDGFRCDVAGFVPVDFWNTVRRELDSVKPVFMLAEWESRDLHAYAFDMTYAWSWSEYMHKIVRGEADMPLLFKYYSWNESAFPREAYRMTHVANHDSNAWEGTMFENYGDALETVIALSVIGEGVPMMYNGQEAGNDRRLKFFEKDPIQWKAHPIGDLYKALFALKHKNTALWNGQYGARMIHVPNDNPKRVLSFVRENEQDKVFAVFNFSDTAREVKFEEKLYHGRYQDAFSGDEVFMSADSSVILPAWEFKVFVK
ncbi:alpha-glucosidase C-terminal domain-containing protein [Paraneptunicella aestuarii]|nr:alpha-glucosidase C-terminal domain-containing protein [Paraneptunicella aestuarii]